MTKQSLFLIIIAAALTACCGCASSEEELQDLRLEGGLIKDTDTESMDRKQEILSSQFDLEPDPDVITIPPSYTTEDNIVSFGESTDINGISYTPLSYEITREFGNREFDDRLADWVARDDQGNLTTEGETYVFVTLNITNNTAESAIIARHLGQPYYLDSDLQVYRTGEIAYIDEWWTGGSLSEFAFWELAAGESITCEVGYWLNTDRPADTTLYYGIEKVTLVADDEYAHFYLLEEK